MAKWSFACASRNQIGMTHLLRMAILLYVRHISIKWENIHVRKSWRSKIKGRNRNPNKRTWRKLESNINTSNVGSVAPITMAKWSFACASRNQIGMTHLLGMVTQHYVRAMRTKWGLMKEQPSLNDNGKWRWYLKFDLVNLNLIPENFNRSH